MAPDHVRGSAELSALNRGVKDRTLAAAIQADNGYRGFRKPVSVWALSADLTGELQVHARAIYRPAQVPPRSASDSRLTIR
jgi:hypothetical protein